MRRLLGAIALTASLTAACGGEGDDHRSIDYDKPTNGIVQVGPGEFVQVQRCSDAPPALAEGCRSPEDMIVSFGTVAPTTSTTP